MKVAFRCQGNVGIRAARVLASDPDVTLVGLVSTSAHLVADLPRVPVDRLDQFDVVATDDEPHPDDLLCGTVVYPGTEPPSWPVEAGTVVGDGGLRGLALSLAHLELRRLESPRDVVVAWSEWGEGPQTGDEVWFPEPLGRMLGQPVDVIGAALPSETRFLKASGTDRWAGVLIQTVGRLDGSPVQRTIGAADDRLFVEAIALGAAAMSAGGGEYPVGLSGVHAAPEAFVEAAVRSGLAVASYSSEV